MMEVSKLNSYYEIIFLILLLSAAFIIRIYPIHYSHWWDECVYLQHAEIIVGLRENNFDEFYIRPPLLPIIIGAGFLIYPSPFTASVIASIIGTIGILFVYLLSKKLINNQTAYISSIFMTFVPFIMKNSRYIMTDIPSLTLITASFYFFVLFHEKNERKFQILSGIIFSLAVLMKFTTGNLIIVFIAYAIFRNSIGKNAGWLFSLVRKYKLFIISAFLAFLPYLIWSQIFYGSFFYTIVYAILVVSDFNEPVTFYFSKFIEMFSFIVVIGFALSIIAVLYDLKKSKKWDKDILVLFVWIVFFILFISLGAHKELRYMIPLAAPVIILAGYGFSRIMERKEISHIILFVIVLFSVISFSPSFARLNEPFINMGKSEEVMASEFIRDNIPQDYVIYANSNYPIFGYYTRYKLQPLWIWDDSFFENYRETMTEDGIVIVYKDRKYPGTVWAENAPETSKIEEYTDFIIYRYDV